MFAQLGDHIFQGLKAPVSFSESDSIVYGQIPHVNGKPGLQPTGKELQETSLTIQFSDYFCDPAAEIDALKKSMLAFEVLPYITGEGRVIGKYVITDIEVSYQRCAFDGRVETATVNISLLESPGGFEPVAVGQALASQKPVTAPPAKPTPVTATDITTEISTAKSKVSGIKKVLGNVKKQTTSYKRGVREVRQLATDAQTSFSTAKTKVENTKKIVKRAGDLPTSLGEAISYAENLAKFDELMDITVFEKNVNQLSESTDKVTSRATPVAGFAGTKEGGE